MGLHTSGFLAIVQHRTCRSPSQPGQQNPCRRVAEEEIEEDWADYRFRITVGKEKVIPVIAGSWIRWITRVKNVLP